MGKTTLLKHIADRKLAIPPNIDVLLCEQEVMADDTPAIKAVLKADTKRLKLLEEEAKLIAESEAGNDSGSERLKQVRGRERERRREEGGRERTAYTYFQALPTEDPMDVASTTS